MALHWADIGDVLGNDVEEASSVSAALATSSSCGRNVVTKGVMVNVSSAARLVIVGFSMEKPWLQLVDAARQVMRRALETLIIMIFR